MNNGRREAPRLEKLAYIRLPKQSIALRRNYVRIAFYCVRFIELITPTRSASACICSFRLRQNGLGRIPNVGTGAFGHRRSERPQSSHLGNQLRQFGGCDCARHSGNYQVFNQAQFVFCHWSGPFNLHAFCLGINCPPRPFNCFP